MERQVALLESSVDFLKEKVKASDLARNNMENKIVMLQNKILGLSSSTQKVQKQNYSSFDVQLTNSHYFTSSLKKVDSNTTANLRKLQDYFGGLILESQSKCAEIQEKMLGMMTQKQKILRSMNFHIQNQGHSIAALEEWIKTDHKQTNSVHIVEENIRQKIDLIQKNHDIKIDILEQKIKYLEQSKESTHSELKQFTIFKQDFEQSLRNLKKQTKRNIQQLRDNFDEGQHHQKPANSKGVSFQITKMRDELEQVKQKLSKLNIQLKDLREDEQKLSHKISFLETSNPHSQFKQTLQAPKPHQRKYSTSSERKPIVDLNSHNKSPLEQNYSKNFQKELPKSEKKELPPKKGLFSEKILPSEAEIPQMNMHGGARGLLDRARSRNTLSRQKEQDTGRSRLAQRKGLPPVRQDSASKKKKQQQQVRWQQQEQEDEEELVYQIDEEGYLMDEDGNYLQDQHGQLVRLSPEEIEQYMQNDN